MVEGVVRLHSGIYSDWVQRGNAYEPIKCGAINGSVFDGI